jgi:signal recognition particle receptor subunit beta
VVLFNYAVKELTAKIVYYGPGLSGKTTNLKYIHEELPIKSKGRMLTLATETDRTLYFDFLPVDAGIVRGIRTRIQLYTVPGQVFYNATRRMVLKGADGVVFVADSQKDMMEANLESLDNLRENLSAHDLRLEEMPLVMQYNKRDLEDALSIEEMNEALNTVNAPFYAAVAIEGIGVEDTLKAISSLVMKSVIDKYGAAEKRGAPMTPASPPGEESPSLSRDERMRLNEKTDPFAAPLAVQAAAGTGSEAFSASEWDSNSLPETPLVGEVERHPVFGSLSSRADEETPADVEPQMKPDEPGDNESEDFDSLNLEGILDEALRVEEEGAAGQSFEEPSLLETSLSEGDEPDSAPFEHSPSGILEEALGFDMKGESSTPAAPTEDDESFVLSPLMSDEPSRPEESPLGPDELDLLEDRFSSLDTSPGLEPRPSIDEMARTQIADDIESMLEGSTPEIKKENTSPEVRVPESVEVETEAEVAEAHGIEVPIQLSISPDAEEIDVKITLHLRINRRTQPED